jgi:beta-ureidopropionase / N-carbamoyl-L-amino-acid hydrolase
LACDLNTSSLSRETGRRACEPPRWQQICHTPWVSLFRAKTRIVVLSMHTGTSNQMLAVDEDRVLADLRTLAEFGKQGTGVSRPAFSDVDLKARRWLAEEMEAAGLETVIDGIGTVYGRSPDTQQSILVGSHSDSVPNGGWLDGALGVIFGLELARAGRRAGHGIGVDVISFADEEGTWLPCLGSRSFCGELADTALAGVQAKTGERLVDRLAQLGLDKGPLVRFDPERHRAYLEAHIEQGPRLITEGINIGVVTGIVGIRSYVVRFRGRADHAGTTPLAKRRDAGFAVFGFATNLAERLRAAGGPDSVWNFGNVIMRPGATNVVPAEADLSVEFRDQSPAVLARMEAAFHAAVQAAQATLNVAVSSTPTAALEPVAMDALLIDLIAEAAAESGSSHVRMPSGAGHDAMLLARQIPAAMMFVPSIDGRSHDITENTDEADIRRGFRVFAAAAGKVIERLASKNGPPASKPGRERERAS